mmetsp:Transcript_57830/g.133562  ORF Transcript_57830/g.133562 Transcript_57830/m.133562 type:complete len:245 (-) Transcript_57830:1837-2571(-)
MPAAVNMSHRPANCLRRSWSRNFMERNSSALAISRIASTTVASTTFTIVKTPIMTNGKNSKIVEGASRTVCLMIANPPSKNKICEKVNIEGKTPLKKSPWTVSASPFPIVSAASAAKQYKITKRMHPLKNITRTTEMMPPNINHTGRYLGVNRTRRINLANLPTRRICRARSGVAQLTPALSRITATMPQTITRKQSTMFRGRLTKCRKNPYTSDCSTTSAVKAAVITNSKRSKIWLPPVLSSS